MSEPEEEDLTKLQLQDLIERAYKIAKQMVREGANQETVEGLFTISSELRKRVCGSLQEPSSTVAPRCPQIKIAKRPIGNEIRGSRTKGLPRSGGGR
jgi:hypothetical protein